LGWKSGKDEWGFGKKSLGEYILPGIANLTGLVDLFYDEEY
jgi:hypothetical protein